MSILAKNLNGFLARIAVAPFAGAWIEISWNTHDLGNGGVAPSAGAWIEIRLTVRFTTTGNVAPSAGAWIGIIGQQFYLRCPMPSNTEQFIRIY